MADTDPKLVTYEKADAAFASFLNLAGSQTRNALDAILPKSSATGTVPSTSVPQYVNQNTDGTWKNPIRDANVSGRIYVANVSAARVPAQADGLKTGDLFIADTGTFIASYVPSVGSASWKAVAGAGGTSTTTTPGTGTGGGTTTTPGTTTTTTPTDPTSTVPAPTVRPYSLLGTTGTWTTSSGVPLVQALSDQHVSTASATPATASSGVSVSMDMTNLAHTTGNDLTVTLWGASAPTTGDVQVVIGNGPTQYVNPKTMQITAASQNLAFTWTASEQLSLTADQWRDSQVTISRPSGGFSVLADVTLQSSAPKVAVTPGADPMAPASITWSPQSVYYSDLSTAPLSTSSAATVSYVRAQATTGTIRLDCYSDAPPIWMVDSTVARINVTPPATSTRGDVALMHNSTGKGALDGVPIPTNVTPPSNLFKTAVVGCMETRQVWEMIGLTKNATTGAWSAEWGGRIDDFTISNGAFPTNTGFTGSGLSFTAAAIKVSEAKDAAAGNVKAIPHAIGLNLNYGTTTPDFVWPATRSDGTSYTAGAPAMGQRFRLKPTADLTACTPLGRAVGEALKRYGCVVMGGAAKISFLAESGTVEQQKTGVDPWGTILNGATIDTALAGIPLDQLEAISPGWGGPNWTAQTTTPTTTTPTTTTTTNRRAIYMPSTVKWLSGASCKGIENSTEGMGSAYAQWRGEPCWFARCWADQGGPGGGNDPGLATLVMKYNNWHASMDVGIGFFHRNLGETMAGAAAGNYDTRWTDTLKNYRNWWVSRRDRNVVNAFISPAHEMNGNWYSWSVNSSNYLDFIKAWKRFRNLQLQYFPESILCFNVNRDTSGAGMDWRKMVPGYTDNTIKQWIDVGGVDYYNMDPNSHTLAEWNTHIMEYDGYGAPKGLERHRQFWEAAGLPIIIPEWSNNKTQGDSPDYATGLNNFIRANAGTGPGQVAGEALFNLTGTPGTPTYYSGEYAVMGDTVGSPLFADRYRSLTWGY